MQTRTQSMIEVWIGTLVGFIISILLGVTVYPLFGHAFTISENFGLTLIFTVASILRGYGVRRFFNWLWHERVEKQTVLSAFNLPPPPFPPIKHSWPAKDTRTAELFKRL